MRVQIVLCSSLLAAGVTAAAASPKEVHATHFELANGIVPAPPGVKPADTTVGSCSLKADVPGKRWTFDDAACANLVNLETREAGAAVAINLIHVDLEATRFDLIDGKVPAQKGIQPAAFAVGDCTIEPDGDHWKFDPSRCAALVATGGTSKGTHASIRLAPVASNVSATFTLNDKLVKIVSDTPLLKVAVPHDESYEAAEIEDDAVDSSPALSFFKREPAPTTVYALGADKMVYRVTLTAGKPEDGGGGGGDKTPACKKDNRKDLTWCSKPTGMAKHRLICLDARSKRFELVRFDPTNHVILPNQAVLVVVRHPADATLTATMQGTPALYEPVVGNYTSAKDTASTHAEGDKGCPRLPATAHFPFAPRAPGVANVQLELKDDGGETLSESTVELVVATTYAGAIRLGFATIGGNAVDRAYEARATPGSTQSEVAATGTGDVNVEVTVGMSAYLFDMLAYGGRSYVDRPTWSYVVPSPYIGVGALTPEADEEGVRAFTSLHLGGEWEVTKSFAVSLTAVARRVTRLTPGFEVGAPVQPAGSFTEQRYEWGWAVIVSASPEFMQLARGKQ